MNKTDIANVHLFFEQGFSCGQWVVTVEEVSNEQVKLYGKFTESFSTYDLAMKLVEEVAQGLNVQLLEFPYPGYVNYYQL